MAVSHKKAAGSKGVVPASVIQVVEEIWVEAREAVTLTAMVVAVLRGVRRLGVAVLEHVLEERDWELVVQGEHRCPKCKAAMKRLKNRRKVSRKTLLGKITYRRSRYACQQCGHRVFVLDCYRSLLMMLPG